MESYLMKIKLSWYENIHINKILDLPPFSQIIVKIRFLSQRDKNNKQNSHVF